jgi:hypothetical protein
MNPIRLDDLTERLELGDQLWAGKDTMFEPSDLPGRYGRVIKAIEHVMQATGCESVVAGGWAVWRHGFFARMTHDVDIVLAQEDIDEFLRVASISGFAVLDVPKGRWPKLLHKETDVKVDILPEGARPGTASLPAPTTIPNPKLMMGASGAKLRYVQLPVLIELKLAAGRVRDEFDVVELMRVNAEQRRPVRQHLSGVHMEYVAAFDRLMERADAQEDD